MASSSDNIADSTDWLNTPLSALTPLESSLRCQVCKDFFITPMITSCSHTFCSLCIRRYLSQEGRCPTCREGDQEIKLRRNWVVEELVTHFKHERAGLLNSAKGWAQLLNEREAVDRPSKRRKIAVSPTEHGGANGVVHTNAVAADRNRRSARSQTKKSAAQGVEQESDITSNSQPSQVEITDSEGGSLYDEPVTNNTSANVESNDGLVACPCCGKRMKEAVINSHLDSCIAGGAGETNIPIPSGLSLQSSTRPGSTPNPQPRPPLKREHLPFINYSLFNETKLRRKLAELGIPTSGSKELMRKRHTEWVNLWNASCDSRNPLSKSQLLDELSKWERTMGRQIDQPPSAAGNSVMSKDFNRDDYVKSQKSNFDELIAMARKGRTATNSPATPDTPKGMSTTNAPLPNSPSRQDVEMHGSAHKPQSTDISQMSVSSLVSSSPSVLSPALSIDPSSSSRPHLQPTVSDPNSAANTPPIISGGNANPAVIRPSLPHEKSGSPSQPQLLYLSSNLSQKSSSTPPGSFQHTEYQSYDIPQHHSQDYASQFGIREDVGRGGSSGGRAPHFR